ncbi:TetR/AcrR family transcriptional regulator [Pseudonocardia oroxyli]|uniref:Transcriptional regulator, TetR family n=1 Tax=Pseudonocardia oroxyli TaxID=366584 RepID=A0A1G7ETB7_PSEOR|nr:TetR/AcrR family transcriptional regulator [Pseudonocardia oroxyli]SDE66930.1 transcriptional regulator, TetR family [Pseudonocardia oroxyli]
MPRLPDKRRAILRGALTVFAREGYTRASIDQIAREAGVSTRTIYNHVADKAALFGAVIDESATRVAESQIEAMEKHLGGEVTDLREALVGFAQEHAVPGDREHFALVRQIAAEVGHIPAEAVESWQDTGPRRVQQALEAHLARFMAEGRLRAANPSRAARHLVLLSAGEVTSRSFHGAIPLPAAEVEQIARDGVDVFLRAYAPPH